MACYFKKFCGCFMGSSQTIVKFLLSKDKTFIYFISLSRSSVKRQISVSMDSQSHSTVPAFHSK